MYRDAIDTISLTRALMFLHLTRPLFFSHSARQAIDDRFAGGMRKCSWMILIAMQKDQPQHTIKQP